MLSCCGTSSGFPNPSPVRLRGSYNPQPNSLTCPGSSQTEQSPSWPLIALECCSCPEPFLKSNLGRGKHVDFGPRIPVPSPLLACRLPNLTRPSLPAPCLRCPICTMELEVPISLGWKHYIKCEAHAWEIMSAGGSVVQWLGMMCGINSWLCRVTSCWLEASLGLLTWGAGDK